MYLKLCKTGHEHAEGFRANCCVVPQQLQIWTQYESLKSYPTNAMKTKKVLSQKYHIITIILKQLRGTINLQNTQLGLQFCTELLLCIFYIFIHNFGV
jgi:hypothetical protein